MNAARRFPSITNEDAIRPHERSFARWSSPDFGSGSADIGATMDAMAFGAPVPNPLSTERADTMAAHNPPSFTVYTPEQVRSTPFRKSMPDYGEATGESDGRIGARTLLKWTGIGIVAGLAVLTALIVVLNFGGDRAFSTSNARSALVGNKTSSPEPAVATPAKTEAPVVIAQTKPTLELDPPAPTPPAKKATTAKVVSKKKR